MKIISFLFFLFPLSLFAQDNCVFDQSTQTDSFIKNIPSFSDYTWNNELKEATVKLSDGNVFIAKRGGCNHFELRGTLIVKKEKKQFISMDKLIQVSLWIAEKLFENIDFDELKQILDDGKFTVSKENENLIFISLNHSYFSEYYMKVEQTEKILLYEIGYYFN